MIYIANWKMNMVSLKKALSFYDEAIKEDTFHDHTIVICPSFPHMYPMLHHTETSTIFIGAQDCSEHETGAFTGQVSARTLAEIGITSCIVGHSERRSYFHETDEQVALKVKQLIAASITPIVCIGETEKEFTDKKTAAVLETQLEQVMRVIGQTNYTKHLLIAYEPVWAIGTGKVPDATYITEIFQWILDYTKKKNTNPLTISLLYGGSVDAQMAKQIKHISTLSGFLIGGASLDFQKFKNIVVSE